MGVIQPYNQLQNAIIVVATGNPQIDAENLNRASERSSVTRRPVITFGDFVLSPPQAVSFNWADRNSDYGVHVCVPLYSNTLIYGAGSRFFYKPPTDFTLGSNERVFLFGATDLNLDPSTLEDITFDGLTFDFSNRHGVVHSFTYAIGAIGVNGLTRRNIQYTVTPTTAVVTLTIGSPTIVNMASDLHLVNHALMEFSGLDETLVGLENGVTYFVLPGFSTSVCQLGTSYDSVTPIVTSGTQTSEVTVAVTIRAGRSIMTENCLGRVDSDLTHHNIIQGGYLRYDHGQTWSNLAFYGLTEAIDVDGPCNKILGDQLRFETFYGEGQALDLATVKNTVLSNIYAEAVHSIYYLYQKPDSFPTYAEWLKYNFPETVTLSIGNPCVVTWADNGLSTNDGMRFTTTGALPSPIALLLPFYVKNVLSPNTFTISATIGGAEVNTTGSSQSGVQSALHFSANPENCENVTIAHVRGVGILTGGDDMIRVSNYRDDSDDPWRRGHAPMKNISLLDHVLEGGNRVIVNEGDNVTIDGMVIDGASPGTDTVTGAALVLRQSIHDAQAITDSSLSGYVNNTTIRNSRGMGINTSAPSTLVFGPNIKVDVYNVQNNANTKFGFRMVRPGLKAGVRTINAVDVGGGVGSATPRDFSIEADANLAAYRFAINGPLNLKSTVSGIVNCYIDVMAQIQGRQPIDIPSVDLTTGTGVLATQIVLLHDAQTYYRITYASVVNLAAIVGNNSNNSFLRLRRSRAGVVSSLASASIFLDKTSVAADTETAFPFTAMSTNTLIEPGDTLLLDESRNEGTGSVLPRVQLRLRAVPYSVV